MRLFLRLLFGLIVSLLASAWLTTDHFLAFGAAPAGPGLARMQASAQFHDGQFQNTEPTTLMAEGSIWRSLTQWLTGNEQRVPSCPLPMVSNAAERLAKPSQSGLRITWLGHSTTLIELDGVTILTDPNWSERASPSQLVGPRRFHPPPLALERLPHLDAVVISHEHYDHLDMQTVRALAPRGVVFHVPLGIDAHLAAWGVPKEQIVVHDWWQSSALKNGVRVVSTPARHFNGRGVPGRLGALWTSWSLIGPKHRVFFSGDSGMTSAFSEIKLREGPFDVALLEIGQYHPSWGEIHLGPLGALEAHARLGAKVLLPIHWSTFELAYHAWSEPAETLTRAAAARGVFVMTPRLGEPVEPTRHTPTTAWWRALPPLAARCP